MPTIQTVFRGMLLAATAVAAALAVALGAVAEAAVPAHGRAWELITPPDPSGAQPIGVPGVGAGGNQIAYNTAGPLPGSGAGSLATANVARRMARGWDTLTLGMPFIAPTFTFRSPLPVAASEDMSDWIWSTPFPLVPDGPPASPPSDDVGLYRSGSDRTPTALVDASLTDFELLGASRDTRRLLFQTSDALLAEDVRTSGKQVYELTDSGLRLFGVDSAGGPLSPCGAIVGSTSYPPNPVSRDSRRAFVSSPDADCGTARRKVYLRQDGLTTDISGSRCHRVAPACNAAADVRFMGATPSGSVAFLATSWQLTDDDTDGAQDLYRYGVESGVLSRLSAGPPGVVAAVAPTAAYPSDDGSRVYFVANGTLAPGSPGPGSPKIFLADGDDELRYVATIATEDSWYAAATSREVNLTPDGSRLVFMTTVALTADDTDTSSDVYLYDADVDKLERISGTGTSGNGSFPATIAPRGTQGGLSGYSRRSLSDDGRHVFFSTGEPLTPEDVNTVTDVYEWEDGDLGLITSGGLDSYNVAYNNASADGRSVFFTSDASLTWDDDDNGFPDLYVAREGGGFADPGLPPDGCPADGCDSGRVSRLARPTPASVGFADAARVRFAVMPVSAAARRRMAASGWLTLKVKTRAGGRVVARASARLGGRRQTVAAGARTVPRGGAVRLRLRLSADARRRLRDGHALRIRVTLRRSKPDRSTAVSLRLEPPR